MQDKLVSLRMYNRLTQQDMAELIGVDKRTYVNKEYGVTQFKANEMFLIAQRFGKGIEEIFLPTNFMKHEVYEVDGEIDGTNYIG
ncbi:transcriptional regulator [Bacillus cereus]|uniref:helix-turn-helix transcriptional regulator n=1 Tax=Bacillus cereus group TaxID=86661 RepID=UPI000BEC1147|nr:MULTISPECIES: helix-turn-helix domain-containing protein [Bacillus cereus group]MCU4822714.1 XRE family transcriptional regulator [Bacillus cereus]MCU4843763.1 XRE family transcriptional regulator [Bacillus cereus]MCU4855657.1 XRE family transcriptional regulator [Bacillus cereus]MCU4872397.1 XRE family transcriptional regulator [Bacillus cereus]PEC06789.1 transcriptional regulator [Bacillus cereus]